MSKLKKVVEKVAQDLTDILGAYPIEIKTAQIKDGLCNYSYEITKGIQAGSVHSVKGTAGIVDDDMYKAFAIFNVHMAVIDDVFKHADTDFPDIDKMHGDELATIFTCTGFKIKGGKEDMSIVLVGNKYVSAGGRIELETPKITLDNYSSYKWAKELKLAADKACYEVLLYNDGKFTPVETEDSDEEAAKQLKIPLGKKGAKDIDEDFANAAL